MSKAIDQFITKLRGIPNAVSKFRINLAQGSRILPSKSKDAENSLRIDTLFVNKPANQLGVVMQVNSQAKSPSLADWAKKHSTHGRLATAIFNTEAPDKEAELERVLETLAADGKENLKAGTTADSSPTGSSGN